MKQENKKLQLNKETIAKLNETMMGEIKGGACAKSDATCNDCRQSVLDFCEPKTKLTPINANIYNPRELTLIVTKKGAQPGMNLF